MSSICPSYIQVQGDQVIYVKTVGKHGDKNWIEVSTKDQTQIYLGQKLGIVAKNQSNIGQGQNQDIGKTLIGYILSWDKSWTNVGIPTLATSTTTTAEIMVH